MSGNSRLRLNMRFLLRSVSSSSAARKRFSFSSKLKAAYGSSTSSPLAKATMPPPAKLCWPIPLGKDGTPCGAACGGRPAIPAACGIGCA